MTDWLSFSPRTKSFVLLVATLMLGVLLGGVLNAWWAHQRFDRLRQFRTPQGFEQVITKTVEPESPEQRQQIEEIVDRFATRLDSLRTRHWQEVRASVDSMRNELQPILTESQMRALAERIHMARQRIGPPPGGFDGLPPGVRNGPPGPPPGPPRPH